jgi:hypothetical protein
MERAGCQLQIRVPAGREEKETRNVVEKEGRFGRLGKEEGF